MKEEITHYLQNLKSVRTLSNNTIMAYQNDLLRFYNYLQEHNIMYYNITKEQIWDYLHYLDEEKYESRSIARHITAIRNFYTYLKKENKIETNIFKTIHNPKFKKSLPNFLNYEEVRKLLVFETKTPRQKEERLIFELLYATGLRVSELCNIKIKDINLKERTIRVLGKGAKERIVFFDQYAKEALEDYLKERDILNSKKIDSLLLNQKGGVLSRSSVEQIVAKQVKKCAIEHSISPHTLRHTFATHMLENGADIRTVQELLGHEKLETTQIYTHLTNEYLRSEYLKKLPRK